MGSLSAKTFADNTLTRGFPNASYRVTAKRTAGTSQPTEPTAIYFGVADSEAA